MPQTKFILQENDIPTHWYNVVADMPNPPAPVLGPDGKPIGPEVLAPIFPMSLIMQEVSGERWIPIPEAVREAYRFIPAFATVPRTSSGSGTGHSGENLLQVRGRFPGGFAQGQHLHSAGVLQQGGGHQAHRHRNRRGAVGFFDGAGRSHVRAGGARLHGESEL
jgi:hypothetical protein